MASIHNVQWARLANVLSALTIVVASTQALPLLWKIRDVLGTWMTAKLTVGFVVFVASSAKRWNSRRSSSQRCRSSLRPSWNAQASSS